MPNRTHGRRPSLLDHEINMSDDRRTQRDQKWLFRSYTIVDVKNTEFAFGSDTQEVKFGTKGIFASRNCADQMMEATL